MAEADRRKWDERYAAGGQDPRRPDPVLAVVLAHAPPAGRALDVACGRGRHAIALARRGYRVDAVDVSSVGLASARERAGELPVRWIEADLDGWEPEPDAYAVIVCVRFTDAALAAKLPGALIRGGVLGYAARPREQCRWGPAPGDVARWFAGLETIRLREDADRVEYAGRRA